MNIELISPDKLRVVLTVGDLGRYELDYASISSDDPATKRLVSDILAQARSRIGFHFKNSKLLIEVVPGKNSGCVLYLTKMPCGTARNAGGQAQDTQSGSYTAQNEYILSCSCLDDTIDAISCFADFPDVHLRKSSLYSLDGSYHLLFSPVMPGLDSRRFGSLLTSLSEYGSTGRADPVREAVLEEHGSPISSGRAVENFIRFFN